MEKKNTNQEFLIFKNKQVYLIQNSEEELNKLTSANYPKIEIVGYAIQKEGLETPVEAWCILSGYVSNELGISSEN